MHWSESDICSGASRVILADNLSVLRQLPADSFQLIYIDPPFNTGKTQRRQSITTVSSADGTRVGFKGKTYETAKGEAFAYKDSFDNYWQFLAPRLLEAKRLLKPTGLLYLHLDYRESHYAKVFMDLLFGQAGFVNEIIWAYDYGARSTRKWSAKHDNILVYAKDARRYFFDAEAARQEEYVMPGRAGGAEEPRSAASASAHAPDTSSPGVAASTVSAPPGDVWWHTIVSPTGKEKTGYATQKPLGVLRRIVRASTRPGDWVLDFFAGSGTTGAAAAELGRKFVLVDQNPAAFRVMQERFAGMPEGSVTFQLGK